MLLFYSVLFLFQMTKKLQPRICLCGNFPHFCFVFSPSDLFVSHWGHLDLITNFVSRGKVASPSHVKHPSWLIKSLSDWSRHQHIAHARLQITLTFTALYHSVSSDICQHTQLSDLRSDLLLGHAGVTCSHSHCVIMSVFTALPAASQRALTQRAALRTRRTATWPTLWSGSSPASSTRCAQRAA